MSEADYQKHEKILSKLRKAKTAEDAVGPTVEGFQHILDHIKAQEKRIEALEEKTANLSSKGTKIFLGKDT